MGLYAGQVYASSEPPLLLLEELLDDELVLEDPLEEELPPESQPPVDEPDEPLPELPPSHEQTKNMNANPKMKTIDLCMLNPPH